MNEGTKNKPAMSPRMFDHCLVFWLRFNVAAAAALFHVHFVKIPEPLSEGNFISYKKLTIDG